MSSIANKTPLYTLKCGNSFNQLNEEEKLYVHYLLQHVWSTFPITIKQRSVEAYDIFTAIIKTYKKISHKELLAKAEVSEEAKSHYENYLSTFLSNAGNYLSFGATKFIPGCSKEEFVKIVSGCGENYFENVIDIMFNLSKELIQYGLPPNGYTAYYSGDITKEEIDHVNELLVKKGLLVENTRIDKVNGKLVAGVASIVEKEEEYEDIIIKYGWCKEELTKGVEALKNVLKLEMIQKNQNKKEMFEELIEGLTSDYTHQKESQRRWIHDTKPVVEFVSGFIETYEDPVGVRGEWESFVAIVDKEKTKTLTELVNNSAEIIATFPWGKDFEKEVFEAPDFTSIDIVGFCTAGLPIGINLPNYDDVRVEGTKNVSLGNVMVTRSMATEVPFIPQNQQELFRNSIGHRLILHGL